MDPVTTQATAKAVEKTAKASGKALDIVHDTGGYLRQLFGDVLTDLVGVVGGAWLHEVHIRRRAKLRWRTEQILQERNVQEVIELSPNVAVALISGAQEEAREELAELWARLLANAMDPSLNTVRYWFIEAVKKMDPADAIVLVCMYEHNITVVNRGYQPLQNTTTGLPNIAQMAGREPDEIEVSLRHLAELRFVDTAAGTTQWATNAVFRRFMQACYPEISPRRNLGPLAADDPRPVAAAPANVTKPSH